MLIWYISSQDGSPKGLKTIKTNSCILWYLNVNLVLSQIFNFHFQTKNETYICYDHRRWKI